MSRTVMLSTFDNPYDPIENFDDWYRYDSDKHHDCCCIVDRIAKTSDALSDSENQTIIEQSIDEFIKYDFTNNYCKVVHED